MNQKELVLKLHVVRAYKMYAHGSTKQPSSYEVVSHDGNNILCMSQLEKSIIRKSASLLLLFISSVPKFIMHNG